MLRLAQQRSGKRRGIRHKRSACFPSRDSSRTRHSSHPTDRSLVGLLLDSLWKMRPDLDSALATLRAHEPELRRLGVAHASVFGSVARGEARPDSDIDVLIELDPNRPMGVFEYARLKLEISAIVARSTDVVNRRTLKPLLADGILRDAVNAF